MKRRIYTGREKKEITKKIIFFIAVIIIFFAAVAVLSKVAEQRKAPSSDTEEASEVVEIHGIKCTPKTNIRTWLFIGADKQGSAEEVEGEENQGLCTGSENYWCVNKNADPADIQATLDFLAWVVTSDEGRNSLANEMGFVTPFDTFDDYAPSNPLVIAANEYIKNGKTSVAWTFTTMPSENWKNGVGSALLEYAQGTGDWDAVKTAFVDGWATEYAAAAISQ